MVTGHTAGLDHTRIAAARNKPSISPLAGDVQIDGLALVVQHDATNRLKAKGAQRTSRQLKACEKTLVLLVARVCDSPRLPAAKIPSCARAPNCPAVHDSTAASAYMTLVTGCYERFIFGLELPQDASKVCCCSPCYNGPASAGASPH